MVRGGDMKKQNKTCLHGRKTEWRVEVVLVAVLFLSKILFGVRCGVTRYR